MAGSVIDLYNRDENLRALRRYAIEATVRNNPLARKSAKRMVVEYAELLIKDDNFSEFSADSRSLITTEYLKYRIELDEHK
ncbi:MAG: hypothetical protein DRQ56_06930 [Gammaproteobacteria bacterium]|nr:MAG: hypothetical protein DRQ56_06930 [Gammaproteobacteria bacterium]